MPVPAFYLALVAAFLSGLLNYRRLQGTPLLLAIPYLFINLIAETYGITHTNDYWIYNIATFLEFGFLFYLYASYIESVFIKKLIPWLALFFFPFDLIDIFFIQDFYEFHKYGFATGSIIVCFLCFWYLRELTLRIDQVNPLRDRIFWITTGVLFFTTGAFIHLCLFRFIEKDLYLSGVFMTILNLLNVVLYGTYILAFNIRSKP